MNASRSTNLKTSDLAKTRNNELLIKGIFISLIGLGVLLSPGFIAPGALRDLIDESKWVGWFALLLGAVFTTQSLVRLFRSRP